MAAFQLVMYIQKFILCHCILRIERRKDWKKKIVHAWSSCFLLVWYVLIWKGHRGFHTQLRLGPFPLLCKERRSQQPKYRRLVPRILDKDQWPYSLPFPDTLKAIGSVIQSVPSSLKLFFLSILLVDTSAEGATPCDEYMHQVAVVKGLQKEKESLGEHRPTWLWEWCPTCHSSSKSLKSSPKSYLLAYVMSEYDL